MFLAHLQRPKSDTLGDKNAAPGSLRQRVALLPRVSPCHPLVLRGVPVHLAGMTEARLEILTGQQVADLLQVSPRTLEEWRQTRTGPPWRRVGKHVRYVRHEVVTWFDGLDSHA